MTQSPKPISIDINIDERPFRVQIKKYRGEQRLDFRQMYYPDGPNGDPAFTKKGINIPLDDAWQVIEAITNICTEFDDNIGFHASAYNIETGEVLFEIPIVEAYED